MNIFIKLLLLISMGYSSGAAFETVLVDTKFKPSDKQWKSRETRILDAKSLDGLENEPIQSPVPGTGFFRVVKLNGEWMMIDPSGNPFISMGINSVRMGTTDASVSAFKDKYSDEEDWANQTIGDLWLAGFNTIGSWSDWQVLNSSRQRMPYTIIWNFMSSYGRSVGGVHQESGHVGYRNDCIYVFNKGFEDFCNEHARQLIQVKNDPWLIGHFSDNEMPLRLEMLDRYLELDQSDEGYQAAVNWLEKTGIGSSAITDDVRAAFLEHVADTYFSIVKRAISRHDPNHLYLGCRFHGSALRMEPLFKAASRHLDIISINWYRSWTPDMEKMDNWMNWSDKPFIITEFYAKGMDSGMGNSSGAGWIVKTQRDRGYFYQNFTLGLLEHPNCVGWHWHRYMDNDPNAGEDPSNVDSNKGIVTCEYVPHVELLNEMSKLNFHSLQLRKNLLK